jgi:nucleoid-associated protein YgaU
VAGLGAVRRRALPRDGPQLRGGAAASRSVLVLAPIQRLACHLVAAISVLMAVGVRPESVQPLATLAHARLAAAAPPVPGQAANVAGRMPEKQDPECVTFADADPGDPVLTGHLHVCGPYDTLRSLAAREYGNPAQWTLIRDASVDPRQNDGTRLQPGFVAVADGIRLHIPRSSPTAETPSHPPAARDGIFLPSAGQYTVRRGDCLWDIAETHYPQAEASDIPRIVRTIFSANCGVSDGQGDQLRDPDLINPAWSCACRP